MDLISLEEERRIIPVGGSSYPSSGLLAEWLGGSLLDTSGNNRHCTSTNTLTQTSNQQGEANSAFLYTLSNDEMLYEEVGMIASGGAFSVVAWFRQTNKLLTALLFRAGTWDNFVSHTYIDGKFYIGSSSTSRIAVTVPWVNDTWTMIVYTHDGSYASLYINGTIHTGPLLKSATIGLDGMAFGYLSDSMIGSIGDRLFYNRSLGATEILSMYNATAP